MHATRRFLAAAQGRHAPLFTLLAALVWIGSTILAQTTSGVADPRLADPKLNAHAAIIQNNHYGHMPIPQMLADAHAKAPSKGVTWKGLQLTIHEHPTVVPPGTESAETTRLRSYQKQACQADAIAVGHITASAYHLSASGATIYGDHIFVVDALLKDNQSSSIRQRPDIIVTRPGGSLVLPEGPVNVDPESFPRFQPDTTHLIFLKYIAETSAYQAIDSFSTLIARGNNWVIAAKPYSNLALPGFTRGALEATISSWLTSCK